MAKVALEFDAGEIAVDLAFLDRLADPAISNFAPAITDLSRDLSLAVPAHRLVDDYLQNGRGIAAISSVLGASDGAPAGVAEPVLRSSPLFAPLLDGGPQAQDFTTSYVATEQVDLDLKGTIVLDDPGSGSTPITVIISVDYGILTVSAGTSGADVADSGTGSVTLTGTLAQIQALLDDDANSAIAYTADTDTPPASAELTTTVDDGISPIVDSTTIAITAVNDAPVIDLDTFEAGTGAAASYNEGDLPLLLAPGAIFTDDNDSFDGATLTIAVSANGAAGDELSINDMGSGPGLLGVSGTDITYGGVVVGSFTGGTNGDPLVITFNADACHCAVQLAMDNIAYATTSDTPSTDQRTVSFTLLDGGGTDNGGFDTVSADVLLDVAATNDAPVATAPLTDYTATEQVPLDLKNSGLSVSDADAGTGDVTVTLGVDFGTLHIEAGGTNVVITDNDSWEVTLTGTVDEINALLNGDATSVVTYTADSDFPPETDELTLSIDDGGNSGDGGALGGLATATIAITAVNDAPQLDLDYFAAGNNAVATYTEGDPPVFLAYDAAFDDDNEDWDGATMTVSIAGGTAGDQLTIDDFGTGPGELGLDGSNVTYEGDIVGTWSGGVNGAPLVVTFNADACACAVELLAGSILYENTDDIVAAESRTVTFTFVDGDGVANGGQDTTSATVALDVLPFAEIIVGPDATVNEDTPLDLTGISITGIAADPATDLITVSLHVEHGTLDIRTDVVGGIGAGDITGGADGSADITITATQDQINATLASLGGLIYQSDQDYNGADEVEISGHAVSTDTAIAFTEFPPLTIGVPPTAVALTDLDGDGSADLVFGLDGGVVLFSNTLTGSAPIPAGAPSAFAFADFDGDGFIDIGISSYDAAGAGYVGYISMDTGDFVSIATVPYAADLVTGDFNGDGLVDIAVADADNGRVAIILQDTPGVYLPPAFSAATGQFATTILTGDFNGDGDLDLLVGNVGTLPIGDPPGSINLMLGNGDGTFAVAAPVLTGTASIGSIAVADFDGDGVLDIVYTSIDFADVANNGVRVALGNGDGTFAASTLVTTTPDGAYGDVMAADLNNDGFIDLVVANGDFPGTISILAGNGDGTFQAPIVLDSDGEPIFVGIGDPDDDGDLDLVVGNVGSGGSITLYNNDLGGGEDVAGVIGITIDPVDDTAVAVDDSGASVLENGTVIVDVLANDTDVDGPAPALATVNGAVLTNPGDFTTLASGATVTLNANGTLTYNPNGSFNTLISTATAAQTGAVNTSALDSFTYALAGGAIGTVEVTVNGVTSADDRLAGNSGGNVITDRAAGDFYMLQDGGTDTVSGGGGSDGFYFGAALDPFDSVNGGTGAGTDDQLGLQGDYTGVHALTFGANNLVEIETLAILSGSTTAFGDRAGNHYSYDLTTIDENVAAGRQLIVNANQLLAGENLTFNGAAETDGTFLFYGGLGTDTLTGGQGSDAFFFGDGGRFSASDHVDGQGGVDDQLGLRGDYSAGVTFQAGTMTNIETLSLMSASDARFAPPGTSFDYNITLDDANVAAGHVLTVNANTLHAGEDVTFHGEAETDGSFHFMMGAGNDTLFGGANDDQFYGRLGHDVMTGGGGNDTFYFRAIAESTNAAMDEITDFNAGDHIDLSVIDASTAGSGDNAFAFIGADAFNHVAGELRVAGSGSSWTVQGDVDGDGIADFSIAVATLGAYSFTSNDFVL
ncbi:MAG: Type secretion C-terminal target domain subclass [Sphingomonas bacterium]|uniref:FG-GAP-like repeat-containing protein n=1 Tax=Sphingomonas bacterium TaxID=1895847 RepID=UPI0026247C18|nr:FG-GAP-like repeat-containing protein [Sphingomonas bacterium]MDB5706217.1 Type secretion C-terminal target domain subclass [Sphingomonas bacterium]